MLGRGKMKLVNADKLIEELQRSHDFFIDAYGGFKNLPPKEKAVVDQITTDMSRIVNAPAVDAVPKKRGVWRDKKMTIKKAHGLAYGRWSCSACKAKQPHRSNFCPNCGADMREDGK